MGKTESSSTDEDGGRCLQVSYGFVTRRGPHAHNEDRHICKPVVERKGLFGGYKTSTGTSIFGVCDGHGGTEASQFLSKNLCATIAKHPKFVTDLSSTFKDTLHSLDEKFCKKEKTAGCTCNVIAIRGTDVYSVNVGDSRCIIYSGSGRIVYATEDHKPDRAKERSRVEKHGGVVKTAAEVTGNFQAGDHAMVVAYIGPGQKECRGLNMTRSFGDEMFKRDNFICCMPDIKHISLAKCAFARAVIASDGVWDSISNTEAAKITRSVSDPEAAAETLAYVAHDRDGGDDITVVVVDMVLKNADGTDVSVPTSQSSSLNDVQVDSEEQLSERPSEALSEDADEETSTAPATERPSTAPKIQISEVETPPVPIMRAETFIQVRLDADSPSGAGSSPAATKKTKPSPSPKPKASAKPKVKKAAKRVKAAK